MMIYAIRRADGTYRSWFRTSQDEALRAGEVYEQLENPPTLTLPLDQQGVDVVRDAYIAARTAILDMVANPTDLAKARTAIVRLGQSHEELLKLLNRAIA